MILLLWDNQLILIDIVSETFLKLDITKWTGVLPASETRAVRKPLLIFGDYE